MISLEKAAEMDRILRVSFSAAIAGSKEEKAVELAWLENQKIIKFHIANPTGQLCRAAQMITEDTIEARSDKPKD